MCQKKNALCEHRQQPDLCLLWSAYPPGGETIFQCQLWLSVPVGSGANPWESHQEAGELGQERWVAQVERQIQGQGINFGELRGVTLSAWEIVPSGIIIWDVLLAMRVAWMPGWNVDAWPRWDACSGCPQGFFMHCKSGHSDFSEPSFPDISASAFSMLILLTRADVGYLYTIQWDVWFNMVPVLLLPVVTQPPWIVAVWGVEVATCYISTLLIFLTVLWVNKTWGPARADVNLIILNPCAGTVYPSSCVKTQHLQASITVLAVGILYWASRYGTTLQARQDLGKPASYNE